MNFCIVYRRKEDENAGAKGFFACFSDFFKKYIDRAETL